MNFPEEFALAEKVQKSAWGMEDLTVTPKEIMIAMATNGGFALGAFKGQEMVGMSIAFPGYVSGKPYLYSHMTGVARGYQSQGIGHLLKKRQREIAAKRGFDLAAWTFDPLIARNAYFNFSKIGVISRVYFLNYYGPMNDSINSGLETDRFFAESFLRSDIVERLRARVKPQLKEAHVAVTTRRRKNYSQCTHWKADLKNPVTLVDIPRDIVRIKRLGLEDAKCWRLATRELFLTYFRAGFTALDLIRRGENFGYVLFRAKIPKTISPTHESIG